MKQINVSLFPKDPSQCPPDTQKLLRWIKSTLEMARLYTNQLKAHPTRSTAAAAGIPIDIP